LDRSAIPDSIAPKKLCPVLCPTRFKFDSAEIVNGPTFCLHSDVTVPMTENNKWHSAHITVKRFKCADELDSIQLNFPENANRNIDQSSANGFFTLKYQMGTLTVSSTPQLP
jgi:hypothetical protein